jgi:ParB-like chromosome segregation protein Spo0J
MEEIMDMINLSPVKQVHPDKLKINARNKQYFKQVGDAELRALLQDIKKRGILVPLIAKRDGTLLAGHNRLMVAQKINLAAVPVQYVVGTISEAQEVEFIIKDNLLRRHLSFQERAQLYRKVFKNFDERILVGARSGIGISAREIAEKTGLNQKTVNYDLSQLKHQNKKKIAEAMEIDVVNGPAVESYKRAVAKMINTAIVEKGETVKALMELTDIARERLAGILANMENKK